MEIDSEGLFVTVEGPNGSGKTTLVAALANECARLGIQAEATCEPTDGPIGRFIRDSHETIHGKTLACMVAADRHWHIEQKIVPLMTSGNAVFSDRYVESSFVLQGLDGVDWEYVWKLNHDVVVPYLSVHLKASASILRRRLESRSHLTRFERMCRSEDELAMYCKCRNVLIDHGYKFLVLDTETNSLYENVAEIMRLLRSGNVNFGSCIRVKR